jgi:hypothetical protein
VLTDLGHEAIQFLWWLLDQKRNVPPASVRGLVHSVYSHPTARRLVLLASILTTFILGAGLGALAYTHAARWAMFPPVSFLLWIVYADISRPIAEIEPWALANKPNGVDLPSAVAVFHLRKDRDRRGRVHRMPNLLAWSDRLAPTTRVVVLDLGEVTGLDDNASLELQAVLTRFATQGRELIVSGLNHEQLQAMQIFGTDAIFPAENICPDFELAIARGLTLLEPSR